MYESNITETKGVTINLSRVIHGVHCLSKYSLLFLPLTTTHPCDPDAVILYRAPDLTGPPSHPFVAHPVTWDRGEINHSRLGPVLTLVTLCPLRG